MDSIRNLNVVELPDTEIPYVIFHRLHHRTRAFGSRWDINDLYNRYRVEYGEEAMSEWVIAPITSWMLAYIEGAIENRPGGFK